MATIRDKSRKTTGGVDGKLSDNTHDEPADRTHDGRTYDHDGKLTERYQGGKTYGEYGPRGEKVTGHYEKGKVYDMDGHWGGKVTGRHSGDVFNEGDERDPYRPPGDGCLPTPPVEDRPPAPLPQQDRGSGTYAEKIASLPVWPQTGQGKGISFLMSKCRHCGAPARVKYYKLLLILTPFALLFYAVICSAVVFVAFTDQSDTNILVSLLASVITISIFLLPGLVVLYVLRSPKGVCGACSQRLK